MIDITATNPHSPALPTRDSSLVENANDEHQPLNVRVSPGQNHFKKKLIAAAITQNHPFTEPRKFNLIRDSRLFVTSVIPESSRGKLPVNLPAETDIWEATYRGEVMSPTFSQEPLREAAEFEQASLLTPPRGLKQKVFDYFRQTTEMGTQTEDPPQTTSVSTQTSSSSMPLSFNQHEEKASAEFEFNQIMQLDPFNLNGIATDQFGEFAPFPALEGGEADEDKKEDEAKESEGEGLHFKTGLDLEQQLPPPVLEEKYDSFVQLPCKKGKTVKICKSKSPEPGAEEPKVENLLTSPCLISQPKSPSPAAYEEYQSERVRPNPFSASGGQPNQASIRVWEDRIENIRSFDSQEDPSQSSEPPEPRRANFPMLFVCPEEEPQQLNISSVFPQFMTSDPVEANQQKLSEIEAPPEDEAPNLVKKPYKAMLFDSAISPKKPEKSRIRLPEPVKLPEEAPSQALAKAPASKGPEANHAQQNFSINSMSCDGLIDEGPIHKTSRLDPVLATHPLESNNVSSHELSTRKPLQKSPKEVWAATLATPVAARSRVISKQLPDSRKTQPIPKIIRSSQANANTKKKPKDMLGTQVNPLEAPAFSMAKAINKLQNPT